MDTNSRMFPKRITKGDNLCLDYHSNSNWTNYDFFEYLANKNSLSIGKISFHLHITSRKNVKLTPVVILQIETTLIMILPFDINITHLIPRKESIIFQNDFIGVPNDDPQLIRTGFPWRHIDRQSRQRHIHWEHVDPQLQFALFDTRFIWVE